MAISFDSEKDMEDTLYESQEYLEAELELTGYTFYRQVRLGSYGIADIVGLRLCPDPFKESVDVAIIELKNTKISTADICQLARYRKFFLELREHCPNRIDVRGYLIGKKTFPSADDLVYLCQDIEWLSVRELTINPFLGIEIPEVTGWHIRGDQSEAREKIFSLIENSRPPKEAANG